MRQRPALTLTALNATFPLNGWDSSSPTTGSAKSMTSVQVPLIGLAAYAVSDVPLVPLMEFWP